MDRKDIAAKTVGLLGDYFESLEDLTGFRREVAAKFNESELRDLCFDLGIDFEELPGAQKSDKVRELIAFCMRRGLVYDLLTKCAQLRPKSFSLPDQSGYAAEKKERQMRAAAVHATIQKRFEQDSYAGQTIEQLAERPDSESRRTMLLALLAELLEEDKDFVRELQDLLEEEKTAGDVIEQRVTVQDQAKTGDINLIGKIEGDKGPVDKPKKKWWRR